jgi:hypothetical protein
MPPKPLTNERTFRLLLYNALASEAMGTLALATGIFLTGFAVALGASNLEIGLLAAVPSVVQFLQFPAVVLVERLRPRRAICVWAAGIGRSFLIAAAAAPLIGGSAGVGWHLQTACSSRLRSKLSPPILGPRKPNCRWHPRDRLGFGVWRAKRYGTLLSECRFLSEA